MTEHTPGPWEIDKRDNGNIIILEDKELCPTVFIWGSQGQGHGRIAMIYSECGIGDLEANARLIAAAPELLEALERLFKQINNDHAYKDTFAMKQAKQAIAKVTGA